GADGQYHLNLVPGSYFLTGGMSIGLDTVGFSLDAPVTAPSVVAPIRLARPRLVTGQLFESDGRPLPGVLLHPPHGCSADHITGGSESVCSGADTPETDEAGHFEFSAMVGPLLLLRADGADFSFLVSNVPIAADDT